MKSALTLYFTSEVFLSFGIGIVQYALPFYYLSHQATPAVVGLLFAVNAISGGLAALLLGAVADRIGASKVWKWSSAMLPLSYVLTAYTHTLGLWLFTTALAGVAGSLLMSTENVVLSSLSQLKEKASILSQFVAMYMFVMGVGNITSGFLSTGFGFRATVGIGAIVALCALPMRWAVKAPDAIAHRAFRMPSLKIVAMSGYACLFGIGIAFLNQFATLILHTQFGMSTHNTAWVSAAATFMVSVGSFFVSTLIRKYKRNTTLALSYGAFLAVTLMMALTRNPFVFSGLYLARTGLTSIPGPIVDAAFLDLTPSTEFSQMFGVRVFGNNVGTATGSSLGGVLLNHDSIVWMAILSAGAFGFAAIYLMALLRRLKRDPAPETSSKRSHPGV